MKASELKPGDIVLIDPGPGKGGISRAYHARVELVPGNGQPVPLRRVVNARIDRYGKELTFLPACQIERVVRRGGIPL